MSATFSPFNVTITYLAEGQQAIAKSYEVKQAVSEVGTATQQTATTMQSAGNSMRSYQRVLSSVRGLLIGVSIASFVYNLLMRSTAHTALRVTELEEDYAEAIREHGKYSEEAIRIERRLNLARDDATRAQMGYYIQIVATAIVLPLQVTQTIMYASALWSQTAATTASTTAIWGEVAALKARAVAFAMAHPYLAAGVVAAGVVAAGAVGYYVGSQTNVNVNVSAQKDIGEAMDEAKRKTVEEYRRHK